MGDRRTKERPRQEQKLGQTNHSPHKSSPEEYSRLRLTHIRAPRGRRIDCELDHAIRKKLLTVRDHPRSKANMVASKNGLACPLSAAIFGLMHCYSITSSAVASSVGGTASPSARAVLR